MADGTVKLRGEAAEVALGEAQAVLSMVADPERRGRLGDLIAAIGEGEVEGDDAQALGELLELGLSTGRVRAVYGPGGEQAALALFRRLPQGRELSESTRDLNDALAALEGRELDSVSLHSVGPGEYGLSISAEGFEIGLRLGRNGARITTIGA
jgi:hypothetical protein